MDKYFKMTITQFSRDTDEELYIYTDSLDNILNAIENYEKYYYRVTALGKNTNSKRVYDIHFGVTVSSIGGLKITEADYLNNYLNYVIKSYKKDSFDSGFWKVINRDNKYLEKMKRLSENTGQGFREAINKFLGDNPKFKEIDNLNFVKEIPGLYLIILDEYNACYIGQAQDLKKRIMRHWSRNDYFSGTGIDMFKAKDTTRIYVFPMTEQEYSRINALENSLVESIPIRYKLNIMAGGKPDFILENGLTLLPRDANNMKSERNKDIICELTEILIQSNEKVIQNMSKFIIE